MERGQLGGLLGRGKLEEGSLEGCLEKEYPLQLLKI
jgi:hypothetical protein